MTASICYVKYHFFCSKCPSLSDTPACSHLQQSFTALMAFSGKTDHISWSASLNLGTVFGFGCCLW